MYEERFQDMIDDKALLAAANAVAEVFAAGGREAKPDDIDLERAIEAGLSELPPALRGEASTADLKKTLSEKDFIWRRHGARCFEPGIPSFAAYVRERCGERPELVGGVGG